MPKYKVKPEEFGAIVGSQDGKKEKKHYPTASFPINVEISKALSVGDSVEMTIKGDVVSLENYISGASCRIELREIEIYGEGEYEKMSREDS